MRLSVPIKSNRGAYQGRSQDFLKMGGGGGGGGGVPTADYHKQGSGGTSPQPLRDFQYFNESKLSKLLYFMQKAHYL